MKRAASTSIDDEDERYYCTPSTLTEQHFKILKSLFQNANTNMSSLIEIYRKLSEKLDESDFPKLYKVHGIVQPIYKWLDLLYLREFKHQWAGNPDPEKINFKFFFKRTDKEILPLESHKQYIYEAHRGIKTFKGMYSRDKHRNYRHNDAKTTKKLLRTKFTVGKYEFGIPEDSIMNEVSLCEQCKIFQRDKIPVIKKPWIPRKHVEPPPKSTDGSADAGAVLRYPITQAWEWSNEESIWYNRSGLKAENDRLAKIRNIIQEIGVDLPATLTGNPSAQKRVLTKIVCAKMMINDKMEQLQPEQYNMNVQTLCEGMDTFFEESLKHCNYKTFMYDINSLLFNKVSLTDDRHKLWDNLWEQFESRLQDILKLDQTIPRKQIDGFTIDFDKPVQLTKQDLDGFEIGVKDHEKEAGNSSLASPN